MEANNTIIDNLIAAEIQLVYKSKVKPSERPTVNSSRKAYSVLMATWDEGRIEFIEQFKVLLVNNAKKALGIFEVSAGGTDFVPIDQKLIFTAALKANATGVILAHNHPSGTLKPSTADTTLTNRLIKAGELLGIRILDHIIVTTEGYYSFTDEGLI